MDVNIQSYEYEGKKRFNIMKGRTLEGSADSMQEAKKKAIELINGGEGEIIHEKLESTLYKLDR